MTRDEEIDREAPEDLAAQLRHARFAGLMRRHTKADHDRAEHSDFARALVDATLSREAYRELLGQLLLIYEALEERGSELEHDPLAARFIDPALRRVPAIARDLAFFDDSAAPLRVSPLPVTVQYIERIRNTGPIEFIAHHYTRYLADLSGGQDIGRALKEAWGLDEDGIRYYLFPRIPDIKAFKRRYRARLNELPLDDIGKRTLIEEVRVAYEFNIAALDAFASRFPTEANA